MEHPPWEIWCSAWVSTMIATANPPRFHPRTMLPLHPLVQFSHWSCPPQIQVLLWYGVNGARVFVQLRPRHTERQSYKMSTCKNRPSFTLPWRQISVCLFLMTRVPSSRNHPVSPSSSPVSWVLPCLGSQDRGTQSVALTAHSLGKGECLPATSSPLPLFTATHTGLNLITFLPFLSHHVCMFLTPLVAQQSFF